MATKIVDYNLRHDDGAADELPLGQVENLSSQRIPRSAQVLRHSGQFARLPIFGQVLRPDHVVCIFSLCIQQWQSGLPALRFVKDLTWDSFIKWPRK